jgi:hypothetical protein
VVIVIMVDDNNNDWYRENENLNCNVVLVREVTEVEINDMVR